MPRTLYAWGLVVLGGCVLALAEMPNSLAGETLPELSAGDLPGSSSELSLILGVLFAATALCAPLAGHLADRIGVRRTVLIGLSIGGAGLALYGLAQNLWMLYPALALAMLGSTFGGWLPVMVAVCRRFDRHRSIAIALALTFGEFWKAIPIIGVATFILWAADPNSGWIDWRALTIALGLAFLFVALSGYALLRRRTADASPAPETPRSEEDEQKRESGEPERVWEPAFTARQALRSRAYRLIVTGDVFATAAISTAMLWLALTLTEKGHSIEAAAGVVTVYRLTFFCFTLVGGFVGDRHSMRGALAVFTVLQAVGITLLAFSDSLAWFFLAAGLAGIGNGGRNPLPVAIMANYFGTVSIGKILGWYNMTVILIQSIAFGFAVWMADTLGYTSAWLMIAGLNLLGALCFLWVRQPSLPDSSPVPPWAPAY